MTRLKIYRLFLSLKFDSFIAHVLKKEVFLTKGILNYYMIDPYFR